MPTKELRLELWRRMVPPEWLGGQGEALLALAADKELSGGSITNVVRRCALKMAEAHLDLLEERILKDALAQELMKS